MKSQARLRLRQAGKHSTLDHYQVRASTPASKNPPTQWITSPEQATWHGPPPYIPHAFIDLTLSETS